MMVIFPVKAADSKAIEFYTKSIDIDIGEYGYITAKATISHNMTTGRFTLSKIEGTPHFNNEWTGLVYTGISSSPNAGEIISGKSIKVTVKYAKFGFFSKTATGYIYL